MLFAIGEREFSGLKIINYSVRMELLEGEATGRSKAAGWPMIRDPQGVMLNLSLEFAASSSLEPDFVELWRICGDMGKDEFVRVSFTDPTGKITTQNMVITASELRYRRIGRDGAVFTDTLAVEFVAEMGASVNSRRSA